MHLTGLVQISAIVSIVCWHSGVGESIVDYIDKQHADVLVAGSRIMSGMKRLGFLEEQTESSAHGIHGLVGLIGIPVRSE